MHKNKLIRLVTSDMRFAFLYLLAFIIVFFAAMITKGASPWVDIAWAMLSVLGVFVSIAAFTSFSEARKSKHWPGCSATLLETRVESSSGGYGNVYSPVVRYEYEFNGRRYEGNQIDYSAAYASWAWAQGVIKKIQDQGISLKVHVNPEQPEVSVIYPGIKLVHFLRFIVGPAMTIAGIAFGIDIVEIS